MPTTAPCAVSVEIAYPSVDDVGSNGAVSVRFAMPKSRTFTIPSSRIITFSGFTSRCTSPAVCAADSARAISSSHRTRTFIRTLAIADVLSKRLPANQLHREVRRPAQLLGLVDLPDVEDRDDVRVIERRCELRLAHHPRRAVRHRGRRSLRVRRLFGAQDLECNCALQPRVVRAVHLAHPAGSEEAVDDVALDAVAWLERHSFTFERIDRG